MTYHGPSADRDRTITGKDVAGEDSGALEAIVEVLEQCSHAYGLKVERARIRRAVKEAMRTWPGAVEQRWWKWLVEAGASTGLRVSVIENPLGEVLQWVEEGVQVATYRPGEPEPWLVLTGTTRGKYHVLRGGTPCTELRLSRGQLQKMLRPDNPQGLIRFVALEPALTCVPEGHEEELYGDQPPSPLARLLFIIRAEWSDIWVVLVFAFLSGILTLGTPMAVQMMVSFVAFGRFLQPVIVLSLMLAGLMAFWAALRLWETYIAEVLQRRLFARVVHDLGYRLPRVEQSEWDGRYGPELTNRFFDVVTLQKVSTQFLLDVVDLVMVGIIGMVVLAVYHPFLLGFDVFLLVSIAVLLFVLGRGGTRTSIQESKYKYATAAWLEEVTRCPLTFKLDCAAEFAGERAEHLVSSYLEHRRLHFRVLFRQIALALALHAAAGSILLGVGGWLVIRGQLTLGQLVAAEMIVALIVGAFTKFGKHLEAFYDLMAGMDKLGTLFDLRMERQQGLMQLPETHPARLSVRQLGYRFGQRAVLQDVQFDVSPGERVGLVGPAGSGKSVLAELLYGVRSPTQGQILLDDHELSEVRPDVWRRHVMLLRWPEFFQGTVLENIHLDNPEIDVRVVREACQRLGLLQGETLPQGLDTQLSATGAPLSESHLRLLVLARALVHHPRLLLLDGLLDGLAGEPLERALDVVFDPTAPWTLIVISARSDVLARCSRLIELGPRDASESGAVAGAGRAASGVPRPKPEP